MIVLPHACAVLIPTLLPSMLLKMVTPPTPYYPLGHFTTFGGFISEEVKCACGGWGGLKQMVQVFESARKWVPLSRLHFPMNFLKL